MLISCSKEPPVAPQSDPAFDSNTSDSDAETIALDLINQAEWPLDEEAVMQDGKPVSLKKAGFGRLLKYRRIPVTGNIVHYKFQVSTGPGPYDVIGIHRVVKEQRPHWPGKKNIGFFYQHGDAKNFEGMCLPGTLSPATPDDFGLAVYLAQNDVDVWGIDQNWTFVPEHVTDHSFMAGWGIVNQANNLALAMKIARYARLFTGQKLDKMFLCGYSSGVATGYTLLNNEAHRDSRLQQVKGFIPADLPIKTDHEGTLQIWLNEYNRTKELIDAGEYGDFIAFSLAGTLARNDPDGESPIIPGITNMQMAMFFGGGPFWGVNPPFHYLASTWENDFPAAFKYVQLDQWLDFMIAGVPWEAARFVMDYCSILSDAANVPFDDNYHLIDVPIFNVCPAGGFGELDIYGTQMLGSTDVTNHIIQLDSPENALFDFGHIDLFIAPEAEALFWQPMLEWMRQHSYTGLAYGG